MQGREQSFRPRLFPGRLHKNYTGGATNYRIEESSCRKCVTRKAPVMNGIIYLVGLVVVIIAILSFFGLR